MSKTVSRLILRFIPTICAISSCAISSTIVLAAGPPAAIEDAAISGIIIKFVDKDISPDKSLPHSLASGRAIDITKAIGRQTRHQREMSGGANVFELDHPVSKNAMDIIVRQISKMPGVIYAEPNSIMYPFLVPKDTEYGSQWYLFEDTGGIRQPLAWDRTLGTGVTVAIVDSGLAQHNDLPIALPGHDFVTNVENAGDFNGRDNEPLDKGSTCEPSWHGTQVAGVVFGQINNSLGIAGVAPNAKYLPVRVTGRCKGEAADIIDGMRWAAGIDLTPMGIPINANPAKVLNLSLGATVDCGDAFKNAINDIRAKGTTIVAAAGNTGENVARISPAGCPGVIAVGATTRTGHKPSYSNFGTSIDVSAPGGVIFPTDDRFGIRTTSKTGTTPPGTDTYPYTQGTSLSAPQVTGVVALMYSINSSLSPDSVEDIIKKTARAFPEANNPCRSTPLQCGTGILNSNAALGAVPTPVSPTPGAPTPVSPTPNFNLAIIPIIVQFLLN